MPSTPPPVTSASQTPVNRGSESALNRWLQRLVGLSDVQVRTRLRGNDLHVLLEGASAPRAAVVLPRLVQVFEPRSLARVLPPDVPPVYRVIVYSRVLGQRQPAWAKAFALDGATATNVAPSANHAETGDSEAAASPGLSAEAIRELAQQGDVGAIARYLSEALSRFELAVRAGVKPLPTRDPSASEPLKRLFLLCEGRYAPDANLLAQPIAQQVRELNLQGFRDAVVFARVWGESRSEWMLRIDLTPTEAVLRNWGRWGDVGAIAQLLTTHLHTEAVRVTGLLKDATLHLSCEGTPTDPPAQAATLAVLTPLLQSLAPQGIHAAAIYGLTRSATAEPDGETAPQWVHWLDLPAATAPDLASSTVELAQQGDHGALTFLLTRLLNPDLQTRLATGGVRVQVRQRDDLLHIMVDGPTCPAQSAVAPVVVRRLKPLHIQGVAGVRIYGRRAGQKVPLWSYGSDFATRQRLVPETTPEFAASDAYVSELVAPGGPLVRRETEIAEGVEASWHDLLAQALQRCQRSLIRTQIFMPLEAPEAPSLAPPTAPPATERANSGNLKVAAIWAAVGALLVVQTDWLLGHWVATPRSEAVATAPPPAPNPETAAPSLPDTPLAPSPTDEDGQFKRDGFTRPGVPAGSAASVAIAPRDLPASPLQPIAQMPDPLPFATFNSRQLDRQIALYRSYVELNGPPDVLIIGSSRALRGVDPQALRAALAERGLSELRIFNFGINGATAQVVDLLIRQILPQEALPRLILWADGARAFNSGREDVTYNGIVASPGYEALVAGQLPIPGTIASAPATPNAAAGGGGSLTSRFYDAANDQLNQLLGRLSSVYAQRDRLRERLQTQLTTVLPTTLPGIGPDAIARLGDATSPGVSAADIAEKTDVHGFLPLPDRFNPTTYYQTYARVPGDYDADYDSFALVGAQAQALQNLAIFAQATDIPLVFVNLPLTDQYLDAPRQAHETEFQAFMTQQAQALNFQFRDMSQDWPTQYDYFSDPSHLNRYGGYAVAQQLAEDPLIPWEQLRSR